MGAMLQLIEMEGDIVRRCVDSNVYEWMRQISQIADNLSGGTQAEVRYVNKAGNDTTGDGSFDNPFLTIAAAMTSITDADPVTKPYAVKVAPGVYATAFTVKNGVYVVGESSGPGNFAGGPLEAGTIVAPNAAQVLDVSFAGAGNKAGGIINCGFSTAFLASFAAIASTGNVTFFLQNIISDSNLSVIGANTGLDYVRIDNVYNNGAAPTTLLLQNLGGSAVDNIFSDFALLNITVTHSGAFQGFHEWVNVFANVLTVTWTSAAIGNFVDVLGSNVRALSTVLTGGGALLTADITLEQVMSDAANRLRFSSDATATMAGINGGTNVITCTPTAARVLTILPNQPNTGASTTLVIIKNLSPTFPIDLAFTAGNLAGNPTYVPPLGQVTIYAPDKTSANSWFVQPYVQSGVATLTNGVSAAIAADVTANSRITATWKTVNGAAGTPLVPAAGRTVGTRAGGGSFVIHSAALATGADVATDQGTYDWHINNS